MGRVFAGCLKKLALPPGKAQVKVFEKVADE
jgi:hypothetical protein